MIKEKQKRSIRTKIVIAALFVVTPNWKLRRWSSKAPPEEWLTKLWYMPVMEYIGAIGKFQWKLGSVP